MGQHRAAILGASGYAGAELVRLLWLHPAFSIEALGAARHAGQEVAAIHPALRFMDLPRLAATSEIDFAALDVVFCALPHATSQDVIKTLPQGPKIIDLSADFRLRDHRLYEYWYGRPHAALELQSEAVYGLTEFYREAIATARLIACTGCNAASGLYPLMPLVAGDLIDTHTIVIDLKTGVSGAGRDARVEMLHAEVSEGCRAYNVARHRHLAEFDQELSAAAGRPVEVTFVPHLLPQNRGILATIHVAGDARQIHRALAERYQDEPFITLLPFGEHPATQHVRGSNYVHLGVVADRRPNRTILFSTLDNLVKGSAGQAVQNANVAFGLSEREGLEGVPLAP